MIEKTIMGFCVRCKKKTGMKDTSQDKTKKGTPMTRGKCSKCGTKMCRMGTL